MIILKGSLARQHLASSVSMTTLRGSLESQNGTSPCCGWTAGLQIWRVPKNILNKEWWTANKGWYSSLGARKSNNPSMLRISKLWNITHRPHAPEIHKNHRLISGQQIKFATFSSTPRCVKHQSIYKPSHDCLLTKHQLYDIHNSNTMYYINLLTPTVNYSGRTALLTSKVAFYIFIQHM